jgi:diguanylate cyclase (GGDEF)-like protein/putative nucleotidyltransferase with HDIG domain
MVEELRPDIVLMDIKMPEMDGIQATREIHARVPKTTVIAYTAYEDAGLVREMVAAGAKGYILKGSESQDLVDALLAAVDGQGVLSRAVTRPVLDDLERLYHEERRKADSLGGLVDHLQKVATTDYLTGLFNHRYFHERLEEEVARAERRRLPLGLIILDIDDFKRTNDVYGHSKGDWLLQEVAKVMRDCLGPEVAAFRIGGDEFAVIAPGPDLEQCQALADATRQAISESRLDTVGPQTVSAGVAMYPQHAAEKEDLIQAADFAMYRSKEDGKNRVTVYDQSLEVPSRLAWRVRERQEYMGAVLAIAAAIDARSEAVYRHSQNVSRYAVAIAEYLGLPPTQVEVVRIGALLHDTGKIGVPDGILKKPGGLDEEEWALMKQHASKGRAILGRGIPKPVVECVVYHHEQPDGEGYPEGLKGDEIPFTARIVRVADVFEAMTTDQPYRAAFTTEEALAKLVAGRGTKFDADAIDALVALIQDERLSAAA